MTVGNRGDWRGHSERRIVREYSHRETNLNSYEIDLSFPGGYWPMAIELPGTTQMIFGGDRCPEGLHLSYIGSGGAGIRGIVWPIHDAENIFTCEMEAEMQVYQANFSLVGLCMVDNLTPSNTLLVWSHGHHGSYGSPPWGFEYGAGFNTTVVISNNSSSMLPTRGWSAISRTISGYISGVSANGNSWVYRGGISHAGLGFTPRFFGPCWYNDVNTVHDIFIHRLRQIKQQEGLTSGVGFNYIPGSGTPVERIIDSSR